MKKPALSPHDQLCRDYGDQLDFVDWQIFYGVRIGPFREGTPIADIMTVRKSYTKSEIRIIEAKVSTQDLAGDVRAGKWHKYLPYCDRFYFLLGPDVDQAVLKDQPCGIIRFNGSTFTTRRSPPPNPAREPLTENELLSIIFSHFDTKSFRVRTDYFRDKLARQEVNALRRDFGASLAAKLEALQEREEKCARLENDARRQAIADLRGCLKVGSDWWRSEFGRKLLIAALSEGLERKLTENLDVIADVLFEDEKKEGE